LTPVCVLQGAALPQDLLLSRYLQFHENLVLDNAQLMLFDAQPIVKVFSYIMDLLPFARPYEIEAELRDRCNNIMFRSYQMAYGVGQRLILEATGEMNLREQNSLFKALYAEPMTPKQFARVVSAVKE
jgi:hypothetical protein